MKAIVEFEMNATLGHGEGIVTTLLANLQKQGYYAQIIAVYDASKVKMVTK